MTPSTNIWQTRGTIERYDYLGDSVSGEPVYLVEVVGIDGHVYLHQSIVEKAYNKQLADGSLVAGVMVDVEISGNRFMSIKPVAR